MKWEIKIIALIEAIILPVLAVTNIYGNPLLNAYFGGIAFMIVALIILEGKKL